MGVCQKCGDKGDMKCLVYCVKCQVSSEHSYCLETLPGEGDKMMTWTCAECSLRDAKPRPIPSIKSARISQAVKTRMNRIKMRKNTSFPRVNSQANRNADRLANAKQPTDGNSDEEFEPIKRFEVDPWHLDPSVGAHSLNISHMSYPEDNNYVHAQPISDPIWRGCLSIQNNKNPTAIGILAHLSSKACIEVGDAAKQLPMHLNAAIFSRSDAWPQKFEIESPTDESIGLYFFPESERLPLLRSYYRIMLL
ncbi:hypothetical protein RCOM_1460060 [Ricinus communis]|uniref:AIPP2-like SPOC-like domain-containing protein n=1 Tax=Ricinus communis TaxID=3988 RepID=B9RU10_RICCO|nr:hypothetical protein RCOM_1460060 [Ricinus communis]